MVPHEYFEHTADTGILANGHSYGEALASAATGMFAMIASLEAVTPGETLTITVSSTDREALVVDWLNELLFQYEAHDFLPKEYTVRVGAGGTSLDATCRGESADPQKHHLRPAVKAATYHGLSVTGPPEAQEWVIRVVLDI